MAIEVFKRYEKKYILTLDTYEKLLPVLLEHMRYDKYNLGGEPYIISNLYYDTDTSYCLRRSTEKPKYKEKLRLRSYGVTPLDGKVFLEIKKKYNGLGNKRRTKMYLQDAYDFIETGVPPECQSFMNAQVLKELTQYLKMYPVKPVAYVKYDRYAFFETGNMDLRLSFDTNIRTRREDLNLHTTTDGELLLPEDMGIMEIKTSRAMPLWLVDALTQNKCFSRSFSKIGTEYFKNIENSLEESRKCQHFSKFYSVEQLGEKYRSQCLVK